MSVTSTSPLLSLFIHGAKIGIFTFCLRKRGDFFARKRVFSAFGKFLCQIIFSFVEFSVYLWSEIQKQFFYPYEASRRAIIIDQKESCRTRIRSSIKYKKNNRMKELAKYVSVLTMFAGVAVLVIPFFTNSTSNFNLLLGVVLMLNGFLGHIYVNNMKRGTLVSNIIWGVALLVVPFFVYYFAKRVAYSEEDFDVYN